MACSNLRAKLECLGLSQYLKILIDNGFDNWNKVLDITEEDLYNLGFGLDHGRILQSEIALEVIVPSYHGW